ncbi:hypothetical protein AKO1_008138 [Acrasis kona]|uniref:USP domain-containing protein n=1 Tax=Acrasis kona TaxID=1008807 RepID=A0AAW2YN65_9EUKA
MRVLFDSLSSYQIPIDDLYQGTMRDYVICETCKHVGGRKDTFLDLQLVIRNVEHLDQAIEQFQIVEKLQGENQYFCEKCNKKSDAKKGLKILTLPDILTLHLKRFNVDYETMTKVKLNNQVIFPTTLDMNKHLSNHEVNLNDDRSSPNHKQQEGQDEEEDANDNIYDLYAVLMHSGTVAGGHYYAYIRVKDRWYDFNDSNVTNLSEIDLEKGYGSDANNMYGSNAYMLMYVRQKPISKLHSQTVNIPDASESDLLPDDLLDGIKKENEEYLRKQSSRNQSLSSAAPTVAAAASATLSSTSAVVDEIKLDDFFVNVILYQNQELEQPKPVYVINKKKVLIRDLMNAIQSVFNINVRDQHLIFKNFINVTQVETELMDVDKSTSDYNIVRGDVIYLERFSTSLQNDLMSRFEMEKNQITIHYYLTWKLPKTKQTIIMDRRKDVQSLKSIIMHKDDSNLNHDEFVISRFENQPTPLYNNTREKLQILLDGSTVYCHKAKEVNKQQTCIRILLIDPSPTTNHYVRTHDEKSNVMPKQVEFESLKDDPSSYYARGLLKHVTDIMVDNNTLVSHVKSMLIDQFSQIIPIRHHELASQILTNRKLRLREKIQGANYPGRFYLDDELLLNALSDSISSNREVIVEAIPKNEFEINQNHIPIRISQFCPGSYFLKKRQEIIVNKDITVGELDHHIQTCTGGGCGANDCMQQDLKLVKIPLSHLHRLKDVNYVKNLKWGNADSDSIITGAPWFCTAGDLILYKREDEVDWFVANNQSDKVDDDMSVDAPVSGAVESMPVRSRQDAALRFFDDEGKDDVAHKKLKLC